MRKKKKKTSKYTRTGLPAAAWNHAFQWKDDVIINDVRIVLKKGLIYIFRDGVLIDVGDC